MTQSPPLHVGDPAEKPASFTTFVLPFAYRLQRIRAEKQPQRRYQAIAVESANVADRHARQRYFTPETGRVLFERARWFRMSGPEFSVAVNVPPSNVAKKNGVSSRKLEVRLDPPTLVVFDFEDGKKWSDHSAASGIEHRADLHTALLLVRASFPEGGEIPQFDELLWFNELYRYFARSFAGHEADVAAFRGLVPVSEGGQALPALAEIYLEDRWLEWIRTPLEVDGDLWSLAPDEWIAEARGWVEAAGVAVPSPGEELKASRLLFYPDNRTFVWTCAVLEGGGAALRAGQDPDDSASGPELPARWARLLNVDRPGGASTSAFEQRWGAEHTYMRWVEDGSLYGFNVHAGAAVVPPLEYPDPALWRSFDEMYFDQVLLLLYVRVTLFRFSDALSRLTGSFDPHTPIDDFREAFTALRQQFMVFTNLYEFPLLSNQQQGLEMYEMARLRMDVRVLFDEVKEQLQTSDVLLGEVVGRRISERADSIAVWGVPAAVVAALTGLFGMNDVHGLADVSGQSLQLALLLLALIGSSLLAFGFLMNKKPLRLLALACILFTLLGGSVVMVNPPWASHWVERLTRATPRSVEPDVKADRMDSSPARAGSDGGSGTAAPAMAPPGAAPSGNGTR